jgi:hypothetical protein
MTAHSRVAPWLACTARTSTANRRPGPTNELWTVSDNKRSRGARTSSRFSAAETCASSKFRPVAARTSGPDPTRNAERGARPRPALRAEIRPYERCCDAALDVTPLQQARWKGSREPVFFGIFLLGSVDSFLRHGGVFSCDSKHLRVQLRSRDARQYRL